jgi:DNA polymerase III delta prime subunit
MQDESMHAFLITGGTQEDRITYEENLCTKWAVLPYDIIRIKPQEEKQTIGISQIRELTQQLSYLPRNSPYIVAVLDQAERLTVESQNALLKTLEEPPNHVRFILETGNQSTLLPTIASRCEIVSLTSDHAVSSDERKTIEELIRSVHRKKPGEICQITDQLVMSKEERIGFLNTFLTLLHEQLIAVQKQETKTTISMIYAVRKAQNQLLSNVNEKLVFDALFFTISSLDSM